MTLNVDQETQGRGDGAGAHHESIRAMAVDTVGPGSLYPETEDPHAARGGRGISKLIAAMAVGACALLGLTALRTQMHKSGVVAPPLSLSVAAPTTKAAPAAAPLGPPSPPAPTAYEPPPPPVAAPPDTVTIRVGASVPVGTTLTVDGNRTTASSIVVPCGKHAVAVGNEKTQRLDSSCGVTLIVEPAKPSQREAASAKKPKVVQKRSAARRS